MLHVPLAPDVPLAPTPPPLDEVLALDPLAHFAREVEPDDRALWIYRTPADPGLRGGARP